MILTTQTKTIEHSRRLEKGATVILVILHVVGIIGLSLEISQPLFHFLTPFNLLISLGMLLAFHSKWSPLFVVYLIGVGILGWGVEVLGVHTKVIFGEYYYGATLGWKILNVPVIMAVNWILIIYMAGTIGQYIKLPIILKSIFGAGAVTLLDFFMEPVAITHDFWQWVTPHVPLQNYVAWFIISFIMLLGFHIFRFSKPNRIGITLFFIQLIFFFALNSIPTF